ncbi:MAG: TIGR04002 family protein [Clostridia bacterium]|nr:TIGR04002 family protein [Clostridia bacterium]
MKKNNEKTLLRQIILASLFAAMTFALTYFVKIPSHNGYIHLGDAMIYIAACLLPTPLAMLSAGIGGMLSDAIGGYTMYILPTLIIKALLVPSFTSKKDKILNVRNCVAVAIGSAITVIGYYIAEVVIVALGSTASFSQFTSYFFSATPWVSATYCLVGNVIQAAGSAVVFFVLAVALDKINIKSKLRSF